MNMKNVPVNIIKSMVAKTVMSGMLKLKLVLVRIWVLLILVLKVINASMRLVPVNIIKSMVVKTVMFGMLMLKLVLARIKVTSLLALPDINASMRLVPVNIIKSMVALPVMIGTLPLKLVPNIVIILVPLPLVRLMETALMKIVPENIAYTVVRLVIILKVILVSALISALSLPAQPVGNVIKNLVRVNIVLSNVLPVMILLTEIVSYINILLAAPEVILKKISGVIMLKKQVKFVQPATHQFMDNIVIKDQIAEYAPFQEKEFEYTTHVQLLARNSQMDMLPVCIIGMFVELTKVILVSVEQHIGQKIIQQKLNV